jgi:hypothetical protein
VGQSNCLGVLHVFENIETLTNQFTKLVNDDTPNEWSRTNKTAAFARKFQRSRHEFAV